MTQTFDEIRRIVNYILSTSSDNFAYTLDAIAYVLIREELFFKDEQSTADHINLSSDDIAAYVSPEIDIIASDIEDRASNENLDLLYANWRITAEVLYEKWAAKRGDEIARNRELRNIFSMLHHSETAAIVDFNDIKDPDLLIKERFNCENFSSIFQPFCTDFFSPIDGYRNYVGLTSFTECNLAFLLLLKARDCSTFKFLGTYNGLWDKECITSNFAQISKDVSSIHIPFLPLTNNNVREIEETLLALLQELKEGGRMVCVIPESVLQSRIWFDFRKTLCEKHWIKCIFDMPSHSLYYNTSASFSILVIEKTDSKYKSFTWISTMPYYGETFDFDSLSMDLDFYLQGSDLCSNFIEVPYDSVWRDRSLRFFAPQKSVTRKIKDGFKFTPLFNVVSPVHGERFYDSASEDITAPLLDQKAFSAAKYTYFVNCNDLPKKEIRPGYTLISKSVICFDRASFNCIFCKCDEGESFYVPSQVIAISSNHRDISEEYLFHEITNKDFIQALDKYRGTSYRIIEKEDFLLSEIAIPDTEDSDRFRSLISQRLSEYRDLSIEKIKEREAGLDTYLNQVKAEYFNEIRSRKHDMAPHLRQLSSACKLLDYFLTNKENFTEEEFMTNMREEVDNQKKAIESLTTILKIFSREDSFGKPEIINIDEFFLTHYMDGPNYTIDHDTDYQALTEYGFDIPKKLSNPLISFVNGKLQCNNDSLDFANGLNVYVAKDDLQRLFDNIINNAIKHGFTDPDRRDYNITTHLSVNPELRMFQIDVTNNGTPLPKGIDKLRYGLKGEKSGSTAGTGEGGHIVKSIVEHYKGDFEIFSTGDKENPRTTIRVLLPIYYGDE